MKPDTRADDLEMLSGQAHVPAEQVRIDAQRMRDWAEMRMIEWEQAP